MANRPMVAFGPSTSAPSWEWVGVRGARLLEDRFNIQFFDDFSTVPQATILVVIKFPPPRDYVEIARARGIKLVYLPIDHYVSRAAIAADAWFIRACDLVLLHSESLKPFFEPYAQRVGFIEHESIYALETPVDYKSNGFVLWIGACEHLPHIVGWLQHHDLGRDVILLTNYRNTMARMNAHLRARHVGMKLDFEDGKINGHQTVLWSVENQTRLMHNCKAAIDIKGSNFRQANKPPTKAQQFIASGIPFGCNLDSSVARYLSRRGFDVADAEDTDRLFSQSYWQETQEFSSKLKAWTSASAVRREFEQAFDKLIGRAPTNSE